MSILSRKDIDEGARKQFMLDTNCPDTVDHSDKICINERAELKGARVVEGMSTFFKAIIFRGKAYIMADNAILDWTRERCEGCLPEWFCKYENLRILDRKLNEFGYEIADTHVYMLPDVEADENEYEEKSGFTEEWLYDREIEEWGKKWGKDNPFPHALVYSKTQPDRIALLLRGSVDRDTLFAMSGVSEDSEALWQIGIDVLPEFGGRGLATYLTDMMKRKVLSLGHIPFYGTSESHSLSMDTGIRAGFLPAWTEVFCRRIREEAKRG